MTQIPQMTDKRFILFEDQANQNVSVEKRPPVFLGHNRWIWSDRLILIKKKQHYFAEFYDFEMLDLLTNEYRPIRFHKTDKNFCIYNIYSLGNEFGFIVERSALTPETSFVNFVKFNWDSNEFQLIKKIEKECSRLSIFIDKMNSSKFVLKCTQQNRNTDYQFGKFINGKIELGEIHRSAKRSRFYSRDRLIGVRKYLTRVTIYNVLTKKEESFTVDSSLLPKNIVWYGCYEWINERLYASIRFKSTEKYELVWADLEAGKWNSMGLETNMGIWKLEFFDNNLMVNANNGRKDGDGIYRLSEVKYFSIPMRKPNPLRQMAWLLVVKIMKQRNEEDPYEAAKEYLPLNSDLRPIWFKDEEK